jgi:hypothetical protein
VCLPEWTQAELLLYERLKEEDSPVGYSRPKYRSAEYCREEHVQGVHASPGIERLMPGVVSRSGEHAASVLATQANSWRVGLPGSLL